MLRQEALAVGRVERGDRVGDVPDDDRTPMRCKPAPYYVAERGERTVVERIMVTGSRVPLTARDVPDRRARPCFLMRYETPNPLRPAD